MESKPYAGNLFCEADISESRGYVRTTIMTSSLPSSLSFWCMCRCPQSIIIHLLLIIFWFNFRQVNRFTMKTFTVRDFLDPLNFFSSFFLADNFNRFEMQLHCGKGGGWLLFLQECNAFQGSCFWKEKRTGGALRIWSWTECISGQKWEAGLTEGAYSYQNCLVPYFVHFVWGLR